MVGVLMWSEVLAIYRDSKKKKDINAFSEWVCRPMAAVFIWSVQNTRMTPNQVSFVSFLLALIASAGFIFASTRMELIGSALVFHVSFVLDCADGQLARIRKQTSHLGHYLDFLMDELKAMLIFTGVSLGLYLREQNLVFLTFGMLFLFALASGLTMTSFTRRIEYGGKKPTEDGLPHEYKKRTGFRQLLTPLEWVGRFIVHYPQYIWLLAALIRLDIYFWGYGITILLYSGKTFLSILLRLGRTSSTPAD